MTKRHLPYGRQAIDVDDIEAVARVLLSDYLTTGPLVETYEDAFAAATNAQHAVACNSGTAALHLATLGIDAAPGQAVVVPSVTFLATANAVRMTGAEVVFSDVDSETGLMEPADLERALERARKEGMNVVAAAPVHLNGQLCDMAGIADVASKNGISLFEDACHALGVADVGACNHSRMACFSTHPVKAIATGEGGMVTTSDATVATRLRRLRSHGMERDVSNFKLDREAFTSSQANPWYYEMSEIGWNYRLPDILCALGLSQLGKLTTYHTNRQQLAALYDELLAPLSDWITPAGRHAGRDHGWHLYALLVDFERIGKSRQELMQLLRGKDIGTQVHYIPVHFQPYYRERYGVIDLPGAEAYYRRCLSVPLFPTMGGEDVRRVVDALITTARLEI